MQRGRGVRERCREVEEERGKEGGREEERGKEVEIEEERGKEVKREEQREARR